MHSQNKTLKTDTAIIHGKILTMDADLTTIPDGLIVISNGIITVVEAFSTAALQEANPEKVIDASGCLLIPGIINTHTHIGMSFFRSLGDDVPNRLENFIFPLEARFLTPELVYHASRLTLLELILGGTTMIADMYFFEDQTARAVEESGIRGVLGQAVSSGKAPDTENSAQGLRRIQQLNEQYQGHERIIPAAAPHAPYSLNRQDLKLLADFCAAQAIPILSHLSEMPWEEELIMKRYGSNPTAYYHNNGMLNERSVMAHCIFTNEQDRRLLQEKGVGISHNASANSKSGKGIAPALEFFQDGARIGLGTDGPMSGNRMDLIGQFNLVAKMQKISHLDPTVMKPAEVISMATIGGARALHLEEKIGSLESGKDADIVFISTDSPAMQPVHDPYAAIVYGASSEEVARVMIKGVTIMENRNVLTLDKTSIMQETVRFCAQIREGFAPGKKNEELCTGKGKYQISKKFCSPIELF